MDILLGWNQYISCYEINNGALNFNGTYLVCYICNMLLKVISGKTDQNLVKWYILIVLFNGANH